MKRPWMPLYVADYIADTTHLTTQQHGAYVLLMLRYWATGSIPADDTQLAQVTRLDPGTWQQEKATILSFFNADLTHKRIEEELAKCTKISRKRRAAAKARHTGSPPKSADPPQENGHANAEQVHPHSQSHTQEGDGGEKARAREFVISQEAHRFAEELARICGHDPEFLPPRWVSDGPTLWIQLRLDAGYKIDVMRDSAKSVMRRPRDEPPATVKYFDKIFARAHAPQLPLPPVQVVSNKEDVHAAPAANHTRSEWSARADRRSAAHNQLKASIADDAAREAGEACGGQVVRFDRGAGAG